MKYSNTIGNTDFSLQTIAGNSAKTGINITNSFFENSLILYLEGVVYNQKTVRKIEKNIINNIERVEIKSKIIKNTPEFIIGGNYAYGDFDMRWEYLRNFSGYNFKEWRDYRKTKCPHCNNKVFVKRV